MQVLPRYPQEPVRSYDRQVIKETQLQPSQWNADPQDYALTPKFEAVEYKQPEYVHREKPVKMGQHYHEQKAAPTSQDRYYEQKYASPEYRNVETNYNPTVTPAPYNNYDYGCDTCSYDHSYY